MHRIAELPDPVPGPGEVVVDVKAASLNFPDLLVMQGLYQVRPDLPFVPGAEGAGVVAAVGEGVQNAAVGDEVSFVTVTGAFAEKAKMPAGAVLPKAPEHTFTEAAGFSLTYATSYYALKQRAQLAAGETVLVLGAAGGVGAAAVELAVAMGANVIAAASSDEKVEFALDLGASAGMNYTSDDLRDSIKESSGGRGVDVVYDPVGGEYTEPAFRSLVWGGRHLVIGFAAGEIPALPANLPLLKGASLVGVFWGSWAERDPAANRQNYRELLAMVSEGTIHPRVTEEYALEEFAAAYEAISGRRAKGKIVLAIG
ncbi:MAG: NADPH:quinone oxidoreductase family protein [Acidimicrobiia bacterium]|nr:NADPH:quinone oxidoreductase family protein [Acidimicrobiia bacterium]